MAKKAKKPSTPTAKPKAAAKSPSALPSIAALFLLNVLVYGATLGFQFVALDDTTHIQRNPAFNPVTWHSFYEIWTKPYFDMYLPLTYSLWAVAAKLGLEQATSLTALPIISPAIFHGANILVHSLNCALVFLIIFALSGRRSAAFFAASFFAVHPLQAEAVSWISAMKDLWSGLFALAAIYNYIRFRKENKNSRYYLALALFVLATLAKPSMVSVPIILFCLDFFYFRSTPLACAKASAMFFLLCIPPIVWSKLLQPDTSMKFVPPFFMRPLIAGDVVTFYLGKILLPLGFGIDYGRSPQAVLDSTLTYFAWLIPVFLLVFGWMRRNNGLLAAGLFSFCFAFLPYSGIVLFNFQDFSTVADRYAYLPMFGASLVVAAIFPTTESNAVKKLCFVLLAALALLSNKQSAHWRDSTSLFAHTLSVNPNSPIALTNLGVALMESGRVAESLTYFERVSAVAPQSSDGPINLGLAYARLNRPEEAIASLKKAIALNDNIGAAYLNLGNVYLQQQNWAEAVAQYNEALKYKGNDLGVIVNLGNAYLGSRDYDSAISQYERALAVDPNFSGALINLAYTLQQKGDLNRAIPVYEHAVTLIPNHSGLYTNLGIAYRDVGEREKAKSCFKKAVAIDPRNNVAREKLTELGG